MRRSHGWSSPHRLRLSSKQTRLTTRCEHVRLQLMPRWV
jgi:hypothetical protein